MITPNTTQLAANTYNNLLDTYSVDNTEDTRIAILRKVQFRNTKDGKPYLRLLFEDVNGLVVIGRMFDFVSATTGSTVTAFVGKLVAIHFLPDYFGGSLGLSIKSISALPVAEAEKYEAMFIGKYELADAKRKACNQLLMSRGFSEELNQFRMTYCSLDPLMNCSDESISKGLRGYILTILHKILLICDDVSNESLVAFLYAVVTQYYTKQNIDSYFDDSNMLFIASMMDRRVDTAHAHMPLLSAKISEFAALFSGDAKVISTDSYKLYNLYKTLCEASNIAVVEAQLPAQGYCTYKNYTIRRS